MSTAESKQKRTFLKWMNSVIGNRVEQPLTELSDLQDGRALCILLEVLNDTKLKYHEHPEQKIRRIENCNIALTYVKSLGIPIVNISSVDIESVNEKLILGLLWMLIYLYQISEFRYD